VGGASLIGLFAPWVDDYRTFFMCLLGIDGDRDPLDRLSRPSLSHAPVLSLPAIRAASMMAFRALRCIRHLLVLPLAARLVCAVV